MTIKSQMNITGRYITNKDVLINQLSGAFGTKRSTIIANLNEAMEEIIQKTSLSVDNPEWREISSKNLLTFTLLQNKEYHTQVPYEKILSINEPTLLYLYICVARWSNSARGVFECPYTRWAKLLQCSVRTAKTKIQEAIDKRLIYVNRGDYLKDNSKRQEINEYSINPFSNEEQTLATKAFKKASDSKYYDVILGYDKTPLRERKGFAEYATQVQLATEAFLKKDDNHYPSDNHYYVFEIVKRRQKHHLLSQEETDLLKVAQRRIKILSTNARLKTIIVDKLRKAKIKVNQISDSDILFITYQEKIKNKSKVTASSVYGYDNPNRAVDELFED